MYVTYFGLDQGYRKGYFEVVVIYWHVLIRRTFCHDLDSHYLLRSLSFDTISSTSTWALCSISQCLRWRVNFFKATSQDAAGLNLPFSKDRAWYVVYGQGCLVGWRWRRVCENQWFINEKEVHCGSLFLLLVTSVQRCLYTLKEFGFCYHKLIVGLKLI
jgi:hypothetical protein